MERGRGSHTWEAGGDPGHKGQEKTACRWDSITWETSSRS